MKKKNVFSTALALTLASSLVLGGCSSAATPETTVETTWAPEVSVEPVYIPSIYTLDG